MTLNIEQKLEIFYSTYAEYIEKIKDNIFFMKNGKQFVIDNKLDTTYQEKLINPDIKDMILQDYPLDYNAIPSKNFSPGRVNNLEFLKSIYGDTEENITKNLNSVEWFGDKFLFNKQQSANYALMNIRAELKNIGEDYLKYLENSAGTFKYRIIAGTDRLSLHSFGIAIDINIKYSNYWRWTLEGEGITPTPDIDIPYKNKIPEAIVKSFEKYGFIWGGHWYHYDTMHFSYRPDLIAIANAEK